jgi:ketosteroid isomerase-like protein
MSEDHVRLVGEALTGLGRRGPEAFAEYLTDDVDYRAIEGAPDDHGPLHGKDAVRAYFDGKIARGREFATRTEALARPRGEL